MFKNLCTGYKIILLPFKYFIRVKIRVINIHINTQPVQKDL